MGEWTSTLPDPCFYFDFCLLITPKHKHVHTRTVMMVSVTSQQGSLVVAEQGTLKVVLSVAG